MCGRYRRTTQEEELARLYHIPIPKQTDLPISYNIAASQSKRQSNYMVDGGQAEAQILVRAFGRSERTVRRYQERYAQGGMAALGREEGWRCKCRSRSGAWKCSRPPVRGEAGLPRRRRRASPRVTARARRSVVSRGVTV